MYLTWRRYIYSANDIHIKLRNNILAEINVRRKNKITEVNDPLKKVIRSFIELGIDGQGKLEFYKEEFERSFLQSTAEYYDQESKSFLSQNNVIDYLGKIEESINYEKELIKQYADNSELELLYVCKKSLVENHINELTKPFFDLLSCFRDDGFILFNFFPNYHFINFHTLFFINKISECQIFILLLYFFLGQRNQKAL